MPDRSAMRPGVATVMCGGAAALLAAAAAILVLRRRYAVFEVVGDSMRPTYAAADRLLVRRTPSAVRTGDVVIAHEPGTRDPRARQRWIVKRAAALPGDPVPESVLPAVAGVPIVPAGKVVLLGDDPGGTDSRLWGFLPSAGLVGVVVTRLSASDRASRTERPVRKTTGPRSR